MSLGFRVFTERVMPDPALVAAFSEMAAAPVADCMGRRCSMRSEIRLMSPRTGRTMAGTALTVKTQPNDNLMIQAALDLAREGDILVVDNGGERACALVGEIMLSYAKFKKLAGVVIDGPIRDLDCLDELGLPVYAAGTIPGGPTKVGPGEVNVPVTCGGIAVHPGDIILGDSDGVIVIPREEAPALLEKAVAFCAQDSARTRAAKDGTCDRTWVRKSLLERDCEIIEGCWAEEKTL
jgi:RraA family protein